MVSIKMHMFAMEKAFRRLISYDCKNVVLPSLQQPLLCKKHNTGPRQYREKQTKQTAAKLGPSAEPSLPQVPTGGERGAGQVFRVLRSPDFQPCAGGRAGLQLRWAPPAMRSGRGLEALGRPESLSLLGKSGRESGSPPHAYPEGRCGCCLRLLGMSGTGRRGKSGARAGSRFPHVPGGSARGTVPRGAGGCAGR